MNGNSISRRSKSRIAACFIVILLFAASLTLALSSCSFFSSEIVIRNYDLKVDLGADGVTLFTESIEADFSEQDSDWWNFYRIIDDETLMDNMTQEGYFGIKEDSFKVDGVSVPFEGAIDLEEDGAKYVYTSKYRNSAVGYFFARTSGVEIGVIMPEFSSGVHKISYSYYVKGLVTGGADIAIFYYKYLSEINTMDIKNMHVTVTFPEAEPELRSWLHNSASAVGAWKQSEDHKSVEIYFEDVKAGEYLESRMLLDKGHYTIFKTDKTVSSLSVENEEAAWYKAYEREQRIRLAITVLDYVLGALAVAFGVYMAIRLRRKNRPLELPSAPIYYREIPEGYTGGEVSPLYFYYSNENYIDESISATMLELVRLGYITITPDEKKKGAVITVLKEDKEDELRTHQKIVIEMLLEVKPLGTPLTMKEFEKYGKGHPGTMMNIVEKYKAAIKNKSERDGAYRKRNAAKEQGKKVCSTMVGIGAVTILISGFASFAIGMGMFFMGAGFVIGGLIVYLFLRRSKAPLTLDGQREYDKLHALAKFMEEFSAMDEHEIPELVLWEDYMVFATAMGIADKVSEQLEIAYPEFKAMSSAGSFDGSTFMILWFFSPGFRFSTGLNFVGNIANIVRSIEIADRAARAAAMAKKVGGVIGSASGRGGGGSFHGGGGGFSGGGFGGRR